MEVTLYRGDSAVKVCDVKRGMSTYSIGVQVNLEVVLHLFVLSPDQFLSIGNQGFAELGSERYGVRQANTS